MGKRAGALTATVGLALAGLFGAFPTVAYADAGPDPNVQAKLDGCTREPADLIAGLSPEWVFVHDTASSSPPPAPRTMVGTVQSADAQSEAVHPSGGDLPAGHDDYDLNVNVHPDPAYQYLVGGHNDVDPAKRTGNWAGTGEAVGAVHSELEGTTIPTALWPESGDRITLVGNWIWDCGHWGTPTNIFSPDYVLPKAGQPCLGSLADLQPLLDKRQCSITGESTEFHPWRAMWDVRAQSNSPSAESEANLYVSTAATRAGLEETCSHQNPPLLGITGNPLLKPCTVSGQEWQDVSGDYSYFLPAPAQPPGTSPTFRAVDLGSNGAPAPTLTAVPGGVQVTFHLATSPGQDLAMYYKIYAGWSRTPKKTLPTHLHVSFDKLEIHRAMDPGCTVGLPLSGCNNETLRQNQFTTSPGEWNLYYDVQGQWGRLLNGEFDVVDAQVLAPAQSVDIFVPPGQGWRLLTIGRECDLQGVAKLTGPTGQFKSCATAGALGNLEVADDNDVPGRVLDKFASAAVSLGTHRSNAQTTATGDSTSTCPTTNPEGCYSLTYTVTQVSDNATVVPSQPAGVLKTLLSPDDTYLPLAGLGALGLGAVAIRVGRWRRRRL